MFYVLAATALIGHVCICIAIINRAHGTGLHRAVLKVFDLHWMVFAVGIPTAIGIWWLQWTVREVSPPVGDALTRTIYGYLGVCCVAALVALGQRLLTRLNDPTTARLVSNHTVQVDVAERVGHVPVGDLVTSVLSRLPGNEVLRLSNHEKQIRLPRLDPGLDGLRIAHLSDLHFTGQLTKPYFEEVIRETNAMSPDIVAITGDIIDKARCLDWFGDTLGRLESRYGVYFVLGNHERRVHNEALVRGLLVDAGLIDIGGRWLMIEHEGLPIVLAGNELPWYSPAADMSDCPERHHGHRPLKICLAHSPDQLSWARARDFDLMLAGHTHGGQVRIPLIGPILSPSVHGTKHSAGTFFYPPTLLHVSRGISGTRPLRFNCPPELARLTLRPESATQRQI